MSRHDELRAIVRASHTFMAALQAVRSLPATARGSGQAGANPGACRAALMGMALAGALACRNLPNIVSTVAW